MHVAMTRFFSTQVTLMFKHVCSSCAIGSARDALIRLLRICLLDVDDSEAPNRTSASRVRQVQGHDHLGYI